MKKTSNAPLIQLVIIESQKFIATSSLSGQEGGNSVSVTFSDDDFGGEAASRRGGWFDED